MSNIEPPWVAEGRKLIGTAEVKGANHNPEILQLWKDAKLGGIKIDEVPWCAAYVGACLERAGIRSSRADSAKSYLQWGQPIQSPVVGCVVVFGRDGGGHVGFVVGIDGFNGLLVLGGNQSDAVNVRAFDRQRVLGYRWPTLVALPTNNPLPVLTAAQVSTNEA